MALGLMVKMEAPIGLPQMSGPRPGAGGRQQRRPQMPSVRLPTHAAPFSLALRPEAGP